MKFSEIYNNLSKKYLLEQETIQPNEQNVENQTENEPKIDSQLPNEETIDLNEEKYKSLLLMVQKALIYVAKDDIDTRNRISDIQKIIEQTPIKAEKILMNELETLTNQFPKDS
jgi:hypothetical protein